MGRELAALRGRHAKQPESSGGPFANRFGLDDPLHVAEMMRVARLYGERPEIFRNVGWRVLVELASQATSAAHRRQFEARILAGERLNGAEVVRTRSLAEQVNDRPRGRSNVRTSGEVVSHG
jgi:hypothetical protein